MAHFPVASFLALDKTRHHLLFIKDNKGNTPKGLAPKDKRVFSSMLQRAEVPPRLSDAGYKAFWIGTPIALLSLFCLLSKLDFSFLFIAFFFGCTLAAFFSVVRPMFKPHPSSDTMMIGLFYSHSIGTFILWFIYCYDYLKEQYGSLYVFIFIIFGSTVILLHYWLVKSNPGALRVNSSADNQEFLSEIERGIEPPPVCSSCLVRKPIRCKHDAVTNKCYIKFDHYCIWIFNAVGNDNHFIFMVMLGMCISIHFWALSGFLGVFFSTLSPGWAWTDLWNHIGDDFVLTYFIIFQLVNGCWEGLLWFQQFQMIVSNVTMNEVINWHHYPHFWKGGNAKNFDNPFDNGYVNNLKYFFSQARAKDLFHLYHLQRHDTV